MYFAIRVVVACAILLSFYLARGFGSHLETFSIAFGAALAGQAVALGVKLLVGHAPRDKRTLLLLAATALAATGAVVVAIAPS